MRFISLRLSALCLVAGLATIAFGDAPERPRPATRPASDPIVTGSIPAAPRTAPLPAPGFSGRWTIASLRGGIACTVTLTREPTAHGRRLSGSEDCAGAYEALTRAHSWREDHGGIVMLDASGEPVLAWMASESDGLDSDGPHGLFLSMRPDRS